ncbi:MAG: hypothetical protein JXB24_09490 [Bacteroidales bacterium]|nr:hypothetical protein [Bacteroidales bacterium]
MGDIVIKEVLTKHELREFIYLPSKIHKNDPDWLPPLYMDEWVLFNKKKNRSYKYADAVLYLAYRNKKPAGRIMGLINKRYNSLKDEKHARLCFMDTYEDQEVVHALLIKTEEWARENGMVKIVGPLGFSDKDPQGFQIEGFEHPRLFTAATNSPYLPRMVENEGYIKEVDLVNYLVPIPNELPPLYNRAFNRITGTREFKLIEFKSKKEIKPYIIPVLELMNDTFMDIYGFVPLNDQEKRDLAKRYLPILDPKFIKLVEVEGILIGFIIGMPDLTKGIIAIKGKLLPFGIFKIFKEMKKTRKLMLMLGGIKDIYRGNGIDILMGISMLNSARNSNMEVIDSHLILETNTRMRAECERLNGKIIKRFRIYQKGLL